jgi:hypothetical protein
VKGCLAKPAATATLHCRQAAFRLLRSSEADEADFHTIHQMMLFSSSITYLVGG